MKRKLLTLTLIIGNLIFFCMICVGLITHAGEGIIVEGCVNTIATSTGAITAVTLNSKEKEQGVYNITLDQKGKLLGKEMDGKLVEIIGEISFRDGKSWLYVRSYKEIKNDVNY